jgi:hypothetical protein
MFRRLCPLRLSTGALHPLASESVQQRATYEKLHHVFGDSYESLHWDSQEGQHARFAALADAAGLLVPQTGSKEGPSSVSLLDLGCGLGHLAHFLYQHPSWCGRPLQLVGVDIVPEFVSAAAAAHPQHEFVWYAPMHQQVFTPCICCSRIGLMSLVDVRVDRWQRQCGYHVDT